MDSQADSLSALADQFMSSSSGSSRSRRKRAKKDTAPSSSQTKLDHELNSAPSNVTNNAPTSTPNTAPNMKPLNESNDQRVSKMQELRLKRFSQMQTETDNSAPNWSHLSNMESAIENLQIDAKKQDTENQKLTTIIVLLENNAFSTPKVILRGKTSLNSQNIRNQFKNLEMLDDLKFLEVKHYFSEYGEPFKEPSPDDNKLSNRKIALFERTEHLSVK